MALDIFKRIQVAFLVFEKLLKEFLGDLVFTFFNPIPTNLVTDMREVKGGASILRRTPFRKKGFAFLKELDL